jgi:hnh endonuclease
MERITENQLILPALYLMANNKGGVITTRDLISQLTGILHPTGVDAMILKNRKDTYFSQKVRNLKSHDTLTSKDLATNENKGFKITPKGRAFLSSHRDVLDYILAEPFNYEDIKSALDDIKERDDLLPIEEIISEGNVITKNIKIRERSSRLRLRAIEYFTHDDKICCDCCGFNFPQYYGGGYGKDCIEIHHIKPIFQYKDESFDQSLEKALQNLLPVCPNCHRVIHSNRIGSGQLILFKTEIKQRKQASL